MTLRHHTEAIRNLLSRGVASENTRFPLRLIGHYLGIARAQALQELRLLSDEYSQTICVDMVKARRDECPNLPLEQCPAVHRSKEKIPTFLTTLRVTTLDGHLLSKISPTEVNLYSAADLEDTFYIENEYLFLAGKRPYKKLLVHSIFYDPFVTDQFNCGCSDGPDGTCPSALDGPFKIPAQYLHYVYDKTIGYLANAVTLSARDQKTDYTDDTASNTTQGR